jgi:hypothetical protein
MKAQKAAVFLVVITVLLMGTTLTLAAQDQLTLGDGDLNAHFNGNETALVSLVIPATDCSGGECYLANGSASGTGRLQSSGTYTIYSPSSAPFLLTHNSNGSFTITQTSNLYFTYSSQAGNLTGLLWFASDAPTSNQLVSTITGTLTSPGGSFARYFSDGGKVSITMQVTFPLDTLYTVNGFAAAEFESGTVVPAHHCGNNNQNYYENNPGQWQHGNGLTIGGNYYTDNQVETLLQTSEQNDASMYLVHRLIAALLNVANGSKQDPVQTIVNDANVLLGTARLPQQINPSSAVGQQMLGDGSVLDSYNHNNITTAAAQ